MSQGTDHLSHLINFSWLVEGCLGGCAYPRTDEALAELASEGVKVIVNLHERPSDPSSLARHGLVEVHEPVRDFSAPTAEQLEKGVVAIENAVAEGKRVVVHCGAGLGRTGTLLACYLVRRETPPSEAVAQVRAARPGSIETAEQEAAIREYAERIQRVQ